MRSRRCTNRRRRSTPGLHDVLDWIDPSVDPNSTCRRMTPHEPTMHLHPTMSMHLDEHERHMIEIAVEILDDAFLTEIAARLHDELPPGRPDRLLPPPALRRPLRPRPPPSLVHLLPRRRRTPRQRLDTRALPGRGTRAAGHHRMRPGTARAQPPRSRRQLLRPRERPVRRPRPPHALAPRDGRRRRPRHLREPTTRRRTAPPLHLVRPPRPQPACAPPTCARAVGRTDPLLPHRWLSHQPPTLLRWTVRSRS
jgi:hypothetical protein